MATLRIKNKKGEWEDVPLLGSYLAVNEAKTAATTAENASSVATTQAQAAAQSADRAEEAALNAINSANTALSARLVTLTQAEYDALAVKDADTFYFITEG